MQDEIEEIYKKDVYEKKHNKHEDISDDSIDDSSEDEHVTSDYYVSEDCS